jgi:putative endonuclease
MCYFAYIIFSRSCNKFYTGHTQDLDNRLKEHNNGEGKFTANCLPWVLIWCKSMESRSQAVKLENKTKKKELAGI